MNNSLIRFSIFLLSNELLIALSQLVNDSLSSWGIRIWIMSLTAVLPALFLPLGQGFFCTLITILLSHAAFAQPNIGLSLLLLQFCSIYFLKHRIQRQNPLQCGMIALISNLIIFFVLALVEAGDSLKTFDYWIRIFTEIIFSEIAIIISFYWFFEFQKTLLMLFVKNWDDEEESLS